jgi:hypothetical protein
MLIWCKLCHSYNRMLFVAVSVYVVQLLIAVCNKLNMICAPVPLDLVLRLLSLECNKIREITVRVYCDHR